MIKWKLGTKSITKCGNENFVWFTLSLSLSSASDSNNLVFTRLKAAEKKEETFQIFLWFFYFTTSYKPFYNFDSVYNET